MDEKKVYSVIGRVEIGTDEYRDLIAERLAAEKQTEYYRNKYWEEQSKVKEEQSKVEELQKQVEAMKKKIENCEKFFKNHQTPSDGDIMSVILSIFGE